MRPALVIVAAAVAIGAAVVACLPVAAGERATDPLTLAALGHLADAVHARNLREFEGDERGAGLGPLRRDAIENRCGFPRQSRERSQPTGPLEVLSFAFMLEERAVRESVHAYGLDGPGAPADAKSRAGRSYLRFATGFRDTEELFRSGDAAGGMAKIYAALVAEAADK